MIGPVVIGCILLALVLKCTVGDNHPTYVLIPPDSAKS